jgi:hypothetical protein
MTRTIAYGFLAGALLTVLSLLVFGTVWPGYIGAAIAGVMIGRHHKRKGDAQL